MVATPRQIRIFTATWQPYSCIYTITPLDGSQHPPAGVPLLLRLRVYFRFVYYTVCMYALFICRLCLLFSSLYCLFLYLAHIIDCFLLKKKKWGYFIIIYVPNLMVKKPRLNSSFAVNCIIKLTWHTTFLWIMKCRMIEIHNSRFFYCAPGHFCPTHAATDIDFCKSLLSLPPKKINGLFLCKGGNI